MRSVRAALRPNQEMRLDKGHPWIYQGNVARYEGNPEPGAIIDVVTSRGRAVGRGYYNPNSKIVIRLLTRGNDPIDQGFFEGRIHAALDWRKRFYPSESSYRLIFSEGDFVPGLIVDLYRDEEIGDCLVVQLLTLGLDVRREEVIAALVKVVNPALVVERSDVPSRKLEGLEPRTGVLHGEAPERPLSIRENGLRFEVDVIGGQKTGYFFDQKENRRALAPLVGGARVLDAFCHTASFAVHAAHYGASEVLALDQSEEAVSVGRRNAELNGVSERCRFQVGNAFDVLREFDKEGRRFDCVILDPPAFAKGRGSVEGAVRGYKEVNLRGLKILEPGGFLVTCSCSHHVSPEAFNAVVQDAAVDARRQLRLVEHRTQALDHPILPGVPESAYLKCVIAQVW